jgi:hypothetical protein
VIEIHGCGVQVRIGDDALEHLTHGGFPT